MIKVDGSFEHFSSNSSTLTIQLFHVLIDTAIHHKKNLLNHVSRKKKTIIPQRKVPENSQYGPALFNNKLFFGIFPPYKPLETVTFFFVCGCVWGGGGGHGGGYFWVKIWQLSEFFGS